MYHLKNDRASTKDESLLQKYLLKKTKKINLKNLMARLCEVFYTKQQIAWGITFLTRPPVSQSDSPAFGKLNP